MISHSLFALFSAAVLFFDGVDDASRPVMDRARRQIEEIRKGDFQLALMDEAGKPVKGEVHVRLVRHEFRFGANLLGFPGLPEDRLKQAEAVVDELFNTVIIVNYCCAALLWRASICRTRNCSPPTRLSPPPRLRRWRRFCSTAGSCSPTAPLLPARRDSLSNFEPYLRADR